MNVSNQTSPSNTLDTYHPVAKLKKMAKGQDNLHVVMFPWLAFGHMMPFFQLSMALAKAGIRVSFITTPRNAQRLPKIPPNLSLLINFVALPLPKVLNNELLPEDAESSVDIPFEKIQYLKIAYDHLKRPFKQFVVDQRPDWILFDFSCYWVGEIASECQVPLLYFSPFSASTQVFMGPPEYLVGEGRKRVRSSPESATSPPPWIDFPSSLAYKRFEADGFLAGFYGENASEATDAERVCKTFQACQAVGIRSCREYEGEYLNLFEKLIGKPIIPVGLLPPERRVGERVINGGPWSKTFDWLDEQNPKSVVFVGFGSECKLTKDQVHEIAKGLELSELPFLWTLRQPSWADDGADVLPIGFCDKTSKRGIVCIGWAPQMEILEHKSIGGSLFHSGWGSVIETLQFGHCLVLLPLIVEQPLNARVLVDKGLAVEVERSEDGGFSGDGIAQALRLAMLSKEGEKIRVSAREVAAVFGDQKLHQTYMDKFVEFLKSGA